VNGSVVKKAGNWYVIIERRDPATGEHLRKWHSGFRTKRSAEAARAELVSAVNRGEGALGKLAKDSSLFVSLSRAAAKMDSFFARIEQGEGSLGLLSSDDRLYREAQQTLTEMKRLLADIQKNPKKYVKLSIF